MLAGMLLCVVFPAFAPGPSMKRVALYSSSVRPRAAAAASEPPPTNVDSEPASPPPSPKKHGRVRSFLTRHPIAAGITAGALAAVALAYTHTVLAPAQRVLTQKDI